MKTKLMIVVWYYISSCLLLPILISAQQGGFFPGISPDPPASVPPVAPPGQPHITFVPSVPGQPIPATYKPQVTPPGQPHSVPGQPLPATCPVTPPPVEDRCKECLDKCKNCPVQPSPPNVVHADNCVYSVYIKSAGSTNAKISLTFGEAFNSSTLITINDLKLDAPIHGDNVSDYFRGPEKLDLFSFKGRCDLKFPICHLKIKSEGGDSSLGGWYLDYVSIVSSGSLKPPSQTVFYATQMLANKSEAMPDAKLYAAADGCDRVRKGQANKAYFVLQERDECTQNPPAGSMCPTSPVKPK